MNERAMRPRWLLYTIFLTACLMTCSSIGLAQTGGNTALSKEDISKIPNSEKLTEAQKSIGQMKSTLTHVKTLLSRARSAKPVNFKRLNCINKQLLAVNGHIKISNQNYASLKDSIGKSTGSGEKKSSGANHYFSMIASSALTVERKGQKARLCISDPKDFGEESKNTVVISDDIAPYEPVQAGGETPLEVSSLEDPQMTVPTRVEDLTPFGG